MGTFKDDTGVHDQEGWTSHWDSAGGDFHPSDPSAGANSAFPSCLMPNLASNVQMR